MRDKQISIPADLWVDIIRYHLLDQRGQDIDQRIQDGIEAKVDRQVRHELYSKYKSDPDPTAREAARQDYLQRIGMPDDYRY